jgi:GNAT superfamily N-acetyltransferase
VRDRDDVDLAELAAVVADEWQRRGLGTALLGRLVERASEEGIERLRGTFFHGNAGILGTIRRLGLAWRMVSPASAVMEIQITLPDSYRHTRESAASRREAGSRSAQSHTREPSLRPLPAPPEGLRWMR